MYNTIYGTPFVYKSKTNKQTVSLKYEHIYNANANNTYCINDILSNIHVPTSQCLKF